MNLVDYNKILILQPENPDGDSVASALALEEILGDAGKQVTIYAYTNIPDYLKYIQGLDRITNVFPDSNQFDLVIIVDTASELLLEKTLGNNLSLINKKPIYVLDHHAENTTGLDVLPGAIFFAGKRESYAATGEIVYEIASELDLKINKDAAEHICESVLADTLGLTSQAATAESIKIIYEMVKLGARLWQIDARRRQLGQKSPAVIKFKGELLSRIEYLFEGALAMVEISWQEIVEISPHYNPNVLFLEEARNISGVKLAISFKSYPDGKITAKIRSNNPDEISASDIAAVYGGGGHKYAAGFKVYDWNLSELKKDVVENFAKLNKATALC